MIVSGLTATLAANDGDLNQTTSAFGINATGAGDDTDGIDGGSGATEKVTVSFNAGLFVTQIVLASLSSSASDSASLSIAGTAFPYLTDTGSGQDVFNFNANNALATGQTLEIGWISGNGFSFESFTVESRSQKNVPDSSATLTLLITAFLCLSGLHKKITSTQTQNGLSGPCPG